MTRSVFMTIRALLCLAVFLGLEGSALAAGNVISGPGGGSSAWTVYAFGNAQAVADAFRALTNFTASSVFQSLVGMVAVVGVLAVGLSGGFNPAMAKRFISYAVGVFLTCYILFGTTNDGPLVVNVEVIDTVDMTWKAPVTVPAIVGLPAAMISTAGYKITEAIEASFAIPDALKMSQGAPFNLATSMLADASQARITDSKLASSLSYYVQDCFTMGVATGELQANVLLNSTNFLKDIQTKNEAVMVNTMLPDGTANVVSCVAAWALLNNAINEQGGAATDFLNKASAWSKTPAMSVLNSAADSMAQWATNGGVTDGASIIKQSAVIAAFRDAHSQAAAQTGNSEFLTAIATTQATETQRSSWITGSEIFNKTMGYIFAVLQVFVYAITPLVLCAVLIPGLGVALLKNFAQILLWLAIWQPMLAIVNFIIISMQQSDLGGALSAGGNGYGVTLSNVGIISERTANLRAAASFVGTMVPALAWALVKGSVDFSRVIGSAVGENFAQGAANTMTTGNYSLNQASMDSFTANKHSLSATFADKSGFTSTDGVGGKTNDLGGQQLQRIAGSDASYTTSSSMGATASGQATSGTSNTITAGSSQSAASSTATGHNSTSTYGGGNTKTSTGGTSISAQAGLQASVPLIGRGGGASAPGGPGGPGNSTPGQNGLQQPAQTGAKSEKPFLGARADINGGVTAGATTQQTDVKSYTVGANVSDSSSKSTVATDTRTVGETGSLMEGANTAAGYQKGDNAQVTAPAPLQSRTALSQAISTERSGWLTAGLGYDKPHNNPIANKVAQLRTPGYVEGRVDAAQGDVAAHKAEYKGREQQLAKAEREQNHNIKDSAKTIGDKNEAAAKAAEAPANESASARAKRVGSDFVHDALGYARETTANMADKLAPEMHLGDSIRTHHDVAPKDKAPAPAADPSKGTSYGTQVIAAYGRQMAEAYNVQLPADSFVNQNFAKPAAPKAPGTAAQTPGNQGKDAHPASPQNGKHAPAAAANQAPAAPASHDHNKEAHPTSPQHVKPAPTAAANQAPGSPAHHDHNKEVLPTSPQHGKPAPTAAANQAPAAPANHDHNKEVSPISPQHGKPAPTAAANQAPAAPANHDPKKDERKPEQVAMAPQQPMQQLQQPQPPQAPQEPHLLQPQAEPPRQVASAQPQDASQSAPNPFSGEKPSNGGAATQGQVQIAEQRAERTDNKFKAVDGVLASAEGRKANELADIINKARDITRNV